MIYYNQKEYTKNLKYLCAKVISMISFQRIETWVIKPFFTIFNFISQRVTYTFAIACITSVAGFIIAAYIAIFLNCHYQV
ncbi:MAG: hypothetical protein ACUVRK_01720 [Spirochaetota bacterium]